MEIGVAFGLLILPCTLFLLYEASAIHQRRLDSDLIRAVRNSDRSRVSILLQRGADANATEMAGTIPSVWRYTLDVLRYSRTRPVAHASALMITATGNCTPDVYHIGNIEMLKTLIHHGAAVNYVDSVGMTALKEAIIYDQVDAVELLLRSGATFNRDDYQQLKEHNSFMSCLGSGIGYSLLHHLGPERERIDRLLRKYERPPRL